MKQHHRFLWPCEHEKKAKKWAGKIHDKQLKEGPWDKNVVISVSFFLSLLKKSNQQTSSHILSSWRIAVSRGPLPLLPHCLHSLIPHVCHILLFHSVFSHPLPLVFPPISHVYLNASWSSRCSVRLYKSANPFKTGLAGMSLRSTCRTEPSRLGLGPKRMNEQHIK